AGGLERRVLLGRFDEILHSLQARRRSAGSELPRKFVVDVCLAGILRGPASEMEACRVGVVTIRIGEWDAHPEQSERLLRVFPRRTSSIVEIEEAEPGQRNDRQAALGGTFQPAYALARIANETCLVALDDPHSERLLGGRKARLGRAYDQILGCL